MACRYGLEFLFGTGGDDPLLLFAFALSSATMPWEMACQNTLKSFTKI